MFESKIQQAGAVTFPDFNEERHYMIPFLKKDGLPDCLHHWQNTVDAMLLGVETDLPVYFMAQQSFVKKDEVQRRPGVHIDGYWWPGISAHGGESRPARHTAFPQHRSMPPRHAPVPQHRGIPSRHTPFHDPVPRRHTGTSGLNGWDNVDFSYPEGLILASNVGASRAYVGSFDGTIGEGGDCSSIRLDGLEIIDLQPDLAYVGTVSTLHESLPVLEDCHRTLVRLNVPGFGGF